MNTKYKVGDKVKIKSLDWYNKNKDDFGNIDLLPCGFVTLMSTYCGKTATIVNAENDCYLLDIDNLTYGWTDKMFEENIKDMETKEIVLPEGWEVDKIENGKIVLKEIKKELPKTWMECCETLGKGEYITNNSCILPIQFNSDFNNVREANMLPVGFGEPILALCKLLVCRDVYRQGWKPNWNDNKDKFCIKELYNRINKCTWTSYPQILSFQSREVRDQFLENFRDLIEEAKELI